MTTGDNILYYSGSNSNTNGLDSWYLQNDTASNKISWGSYPTNKISITTAPNNTITLPKISPPTDALHKLQELIEKDIIKKHIDEQLKKETFQIFKNPDVQVIFPTEPPKELSKYKEKGWETLLTDPKILSILKETGRIVLEKPDGTSVTLVLIETEDGQNLLYQET